MFIIIKTDESNVYIMDTQDNLVVDVVPKSVYLQAKALGVPIDDRYIDDLGDFDTNILRGGMFEHGVENVLNEIRELNGKEKLGDLSFNKLPLNKLSEVVSDGLSKIKTVCNKPYSELLLSGEVQAYNKIIDSARNYSDDEDLYADDDMEDEIFDEKDEIDDYDDNADYDETEYDDDDYDDEYYDDDSSQNLFIVSQLYNKLSKEQIELLNEYSKLHARIVFGDSTGELGLKSNSSDDYRRWKREYLSSIHGEEDWEYDGYYDTGEFPGDYCEMGHPLRYVHLARGLKSGKIIKFGIKCIGDFFEVNSDVTSGLLKAQRENFNDLLELNNIYSSQDSVRTALNSLIVLSVVIDAEVENGKLKGNDKELFLIGKKFCDSTMVMPNSLTKLIKKSLYRAETLKDICFTGDVRKRVLRDCFGEQAETVFSSIVNKFDNAFDYKFFSYLGIESYKKSFMSSFSNLLDLTFNTNLEGIYKYNPVLGLNVRGEGGKSKKAKRVYVIREENAKQNFWYTEDNFDRFNNIKEFFGIIGDLVDANNLFDSFSSNWKPMYLRVYDEKYHNLKLIEDCKDAVKALMDVMSSKRYYSSFEYVNKAYKENLDKFAHAKSLLQGFKSGFTLICKEVVLDTPEVDDKESKGILCDFTSLGLEDTIKSIDEALGVIAKTKFNDMFRIENDFALSVYNTICSTRRVSEKQGYVISKMVDKLESALNSIESGENPTLSGDSSETVKLLEDCTEAIKLLESGKYFKEFVEIVPSHTLEKMKSVLTSICHSKSASEKQMYYVECARKVLDSVNKK